MTLTRVNSNGITEIDKTKISGTAITAADTGTVTSAMIADGQVTSAKIADATIVNQDVSLTAAIEGTKISPNFGSQNVVTTGQLSAAGINYPTSGSLSGRNRIINGDMRIDQRNAGASLAITTTDQYSVDRFQGAIFGSGTGRFSLQQSSTAPTGHINSLLATVTTTDSSPSANYGYAIIQMVEGLNLSDLALGSASALSITLSFQVRSSVTGTFPIVFQNSAADRAFGGQYTINAANTWESKSITISGVTSGTWLTTNGIGARVIFGLGGGSSRTMSSGFQTIGGAVTQTNVTGSTNLLATNGATFYITGVQLEAGTVATPFERRSYGQELALCERYFEKCYEIDTAVGANVSTTGFGLSYLTGTSDTSGNAVFFVTYSTRKRARPTVTTYLNTGTSGKWSYGRLGAFADANTALTQDGQKGCGIYLNVGANNVACYYYGAWTASAEL